MLELAEAIWKKINGPEVPLHTVSDPPFEHDIQKRIPSVEKAKRLLGFQATTTLDAMLDELIPGSSRRSQTICYRSLNKARCRRGGQGLSRLPGG